MYIKSLKIVNFRKFGDKKNVLELVKPKSSLENNKSENTNVAKATTLIVGKNNSGKTTIAVALNKIIKNENFKSTDFNFFI